MTVHIDAAKLIKDRFGGRKQLHDRLTREGHSLGKKALDMWCHRGRIPTTWLTVLMSLCERDGRPLQISDYMRSGSRKAAESDKPADLNFLE